jgi:transposase
MTMLAETVDAVIGIDTHRDSHEVEIADPAGRPITTVQVSNDSAGFARVLATIAEVVPGPRVAVCIEGTRSYGIGLARALAAAGLLVIECEQPSRKRRRGRGKSDPVDAHLAVLAALRLEVSRVPVPRADGDREALRILLVARQEVRAARNAQGGRLRALLLAGDDADRRAARGSLSKSALAALAGRDLPAGASREQAVRQAEITRLALALGQARHQLKDNDAQLLAIVAGIAPGLTSRFGIGPVSAAQAIVPPRPLPQRSSIRRPRRDQPDPSQQRPHHPAPPQPRRRPRPQPRHPRHRRQPDAQLPPHPRLRHPAHRRGQDHPRNPPLPQAIHRPRALPAAHPDDESSREPLTNIEASEGWGSNPSERARSKALAVGERPLLVPRL